jgi:T-complex protein 1 subunit alpha
MHVNGYAFEGCRSS